MYFRCTKSPHRSAVSHNCCDNGANGCLRIVCMSITPSAPEATNVRWVLPVVEDSLQSAGTSRVSAPMSPPVLAFLSKRG